MLRKRDRIESLRSLSINNAITSFTNVRAASDLAVRYALNGLSRSVVRVVLKVILPRLEFFTSSSTILSIAASLAIVDLRFATV